MVALSRQLALEAERRFPVRLVVAVPPVGFGERLERMRAWLDETCGSDGWETAPDGMRGVVIDAIALYLREATFAAAFAARWCRPAEDGCYRLREDEPARRAPAGWHETP
jgi:hypothetical protein